MRLAFVGCGAAGRAVGLKWIEAGHTIRSVRARTTAAAAVRALGQGEPNGPLDTAAAVIFATPDDALASVAEEYTLRADQLAVHLSGAHASTILAPTGARTASLHPLRAFADLEASVRELPDTYLFVEGDEGVEELARGLGGPVVRIDTDQKTIYHAAAAIASNYTVTLIQIARDLFESVGVPPDDAHQALVELVRGSVANVAAVGLPDALTGPAARGDVALIRRHLAALDEPTRALYRHLLGATIPIARDKGGISADEAAQLEELADETGGSS
ncbi:MAG: DUF2520 domain-containing protein [Planctomycetota bacterium]|nr:DUF2520 domain-containing protein [Planctomycetota bacterium]